MLRFGMARPHGRTADHVDPAIPSAAAKQPALLVAFPVPAVLPLPFDAGSVGRDWLGQHGAYDKEVSGAHLRFMRAGGVSMVCDVGSRNGTWINGRVVAANENIGLMDGTIIRFGRTIMVYRDSLMGPREPAPNVGAMVGPFGLRRVDAAIEALTRHPPRTVLVEGETGTGKELAAHAIAEALGRSRPFAPVNVAGVAPGVFESQLFGHVAGAFSDAREASRGLVVAHQGGTLFLDEIGELPLALQPKLLRLLENREVLPVGAERPVLADVLIIAATNQPLEHMVSDGRFRPDLWARLEMARVQLPALRQRIEDLFAIARAVGPTVGATVEAPVCEVEAIERLMLAPWPTNVRGLLAALGRVAAADPRPGLRLWAVDEVVGKHLDAPAPVTRAAVDAALAACEGNESRAARRLGISRGKLRRLLRKPGATD